MAAQVQLHQRFATAGTLLRAMAEAARPRERLSVSQWADSQRVLSGKASAEPGRWKTSRVPWTREIMDCLSVHSPVKRVVMMFAAQLAKTETGLNWIGYIIDHAPAPTLCVVPTLEVRKRWVKQRLDPLLAETPTLNEKVHVQASRDTSNTAEMKDFPGGLLVLGGANSPSSLKSMPIQNVLLDELDEFPWDVGGKGDPISLIESRSKRFPRRKMLLVSTPSIAGASQIEGQWLLSDQRRYFVPCPDCGEYQWLKWANLRWNAAVTRVVYVCEHCGVEIEERNKPAMLAQAEWRPTATGSWRGYHLSDLYSLPGFGDTWADLVHDFLRKKNDPAKLKQFVNEVLGETWEDRSRAVKPHQLQERAEPYKLRQIPPGCLLLTCGIDVQDDRYAVLIVGWGRNDVCWIIDWFEMPADPSRVTSWSALSDSVNREILNRFGRQLRIAATGIDTGGHFTHETYQWVRSQPVRNVMALKGSNVPNKPILAGRPTWQDINARGKVIKRGVQLWTVGTDTAKHVLFARLHGDDQVTPGERLIRFSDDLDEEFYLQLTGEKFDPQKNRWVPLRGRRHEVLDCWVYALAAAHHPQVRLHTMRPSDWARLEAALEVEPEAAAEPEGRPAPAGRRAKRPRTPSGFGSDEWNL